MKRENLVKRTYEAEEMQENPQSTDRCVITLGMIDHGSILHSQRAAVAAKCRRETAGIRADGAMIFGCQGLDLSSCPMISSVSCDQ